ncbi:unnamed protein product [Rotaria sp. Silwood2]|nr:unnamed protein product [Rotaria sp. Silwood2]
MFPSDVCHQGTILISGGCGGLGLTMSRWMIEERGVKRLMLMSRRTLSQLDQLDNSEYKEWLRLQRAAKEHGARLDVVQADVTKFEHVRDLIQKLGQTPYPIRGIIHCAAVQEDRSLAKLTEENITRIKKPKICGAWNLHRASQLAGTPLHFFLLFSSIRNHLIDLGSSSYNAGNQFLDILAQYRVKQLHLPALSISLPAVSGAGMFHRQRDMLTSLQCTTEFESVPTVAVFELIERFYVDQNNCPCPIIFAANWQKLYENYPNLVTHQLRKLVIKQYTVMNDSATSIFSSTRPDTTSFVDMSLEIIIQRIQMTVARLLTAKNVDDISVDRSLISLGMDSLAVVSLYNWLGQETNIFIPLSDLLKGISIRAMAEHVHRKFTANKQTNIASNVTERKSLVDSIKKMIPNSSTACFALA